MNVLNQCDNVNLQYDERNCENAELVDLNPIRISMKLMRMSMAYKIFKMILI